MDDLPNGTESLTESLRGTLVDEVAERLREAILTGRIAPRQRIRVRDYEERFGISHIPIREALRRLEAEGLIENLPQRGAVATAISLQELIDLYDLRRIIESAVVARALSKLTPEHLARIQAALLHLEAVPQAPDIGEFLKAHQAFHWAVMEPGASPLIERTLRQLWQTSERYVRLAVTAFHTSEEGGRQHREIYEACRAGDVARLREAVIVHLSLTDGAIREWYERNKDTPDGASTRGRRRR